MSKKVSKSAAPRPAQKQAAKGAKKPSPKEVLAGFKKQGARIETAARVSVRTKADVAFWYTPGVGVASRHLAEHPEDTRAMSVKKNSVAVVSDGSAVLGLGNIGPYGALPVMEGKALLFKNLAGIDAWPIVLDTQDPQEIVRTVRAIAPAFGGINLEDIAAPNCFAIEQELNETLSIPVMHDDQHGTAIVVLAGLYNAVKVAKKSLPKLRVVISGAGAAGVAVARLLHVAGVKDVIVLDRTGIISSAREGLTPIKQELASFTNPRNLSGGLAEAIAGADAFIGLSGKGALSPEAVGHMAPQAIVFALANPDPEILPDEAKAAGAVVVATGRSDFPNQINNALVFPGVFRGALDRGVNKITDDSKIRAAKALANLVPKPNANKIIPDLLDKGIVPAVAKAIR